MCQIQLWLTKNLFPSVNIAIITTNGYHSPRYTERHRMSLLLACWHGLCNTGLFEHVIEHVSYTSEMYISCALYQNENKKHFPIKSKNSFLSWPALLAAQE